LTLSRQRLLCTRSSRLVSTILQHCLGWFTEDRDSQAPVRPKCRSPRVVSQTRKFDCSLTRLRHTELHWLSGSSTSSERLFTDACSARLHNIWSTVARCPPTSPVVNVFAPPAAVSSTYHDITGPNKFGRGAFSVAGPVVWNSLPARLRDPSLSSDSFKPALETHVFKEYQ